VATRKATVTWEGRFKGGKGSFSCESGSLSGNYSAGSRFENEKGSNPEELLAAAEASCFSMALSANLERAGATPKKIQTEGACTVERVDDKPTITAITLDVTASVDGISDEEFQKVAETTKETCPVSRAFKGNVRLEVNARLA
jgi:osmotically inducible protein OsmC